MVLRAGRKKIAIDKNDFSVTINHEKIKFDAVFIGMHGTPGEDGKLQGYFDILGIPYTSCNAASSAITFNKRYTVAIAAMAGIHVAKSLHLFKHTKYELRFYSFFITNYHYLLSQTMGVPVLA